MKRAFDATLAGVGLVLSAPFWIVFAAAIKLEDGGPVFYRQSRVGLGGRPLLTEVQVAALTKVGPRSNRSPSALLIIFVSS